MNFSIIIPLYNEADNVLALNNEILNTIKNFKKDKNFNFEIIYIDDGSTDDTFNIINNFKNITPTLVVKNYVNLSQSTSILNGIGSSSHDNIILLDGDMQNDPKDFIPMIEVYNENANCVVHGYRKYRKDPYWSKVLPSKIANFFVRKFTNSKISDHGCSLKIFNKKVVNVQNFFGDFHRLFAAQINQKKTNIIEVEVNHRPRLNGLSKYGFERVFKVLIDLIFIKFVKNDRSYFYTLGFLGLFSFFFSIVTFVCMIYFKFFLDKSFIETPLPIISIFFAVAGLIFFSIILTLETMQKMLLNTNNPNKKYQVFKIS
tara:strand:- start:517 stop:1464 length:948 start_codon:yes stop_codon:yes gene_type:complete